MSLDSLPTWQRTTSTQRASPSSGSTSTSLDEHAGRFIGTPRDPRQLCPSPPPVTVNPTRSNATALHTTRRKRTQLFPAHSLICVSNYVSALAAPLVLPAFRKPDVIRKPRRPENDIAAMRPQAHALCCISQPTACLVVHPRTMVAKEHVPAGAIDEVAQHLWPMLWYTNARFHRTIQCTTHHLTSTCAARHSTPPRAARCAAPETGRQAGLSLALRKPEPQHSRTPMRPRKWCCDVHDVAATDILAGAVFGLIHNHQDLMSFQLQLDAFPMFSRPKFWDFLHARGTGLFM
ncbi:hypothetical protein B0H11DRAFT_2225716 [Mycena galericulata]|nr:hypothetical protein B0H11DRAFT_2225716 [Mycena galericulata]